MLEDFAPFGIQMVAISPDTVAEAARMKRRHRLSMPVLSDEKLEVIDLYGLRHEKGFGAPRAGSMVRPLAIPTTFLLDAEGVVRWIDQAEDYRVRSNPERVLEAVRGAFGPPPGTAREGS
jgi:peroxiredoxin